MTKTDASATIGATMRRSSRLVGMRRQMGRVLAAATLLIASTALAAAPAGAAPGISAFDGAVTSNEAGDAYTQAGGHPYAMSSDIAYNATVDPLLQFPFPDGDIKTVEVELPPGVMGNPQAVPMCSLGDFFKGSTKANACPVDTQVGVADVRPPAGREVVAVYNIPPGDGSIPAAFGFRVAGVPVILEASIRSGSDYGVSITSRNINQGLQINSTNVTVWGVPAASQHDRQRCRQLSYSGDPAVVRWGCPGDGSLVQDDYSPHSVDVAPAALLSLPTSCSAAGVGLETRVSVDWWENPGVFDHSSFVSHLPPGYPLDRSLWGAPQGPEGCDKLPFDPSLGVRPVSRVAGQPTGVGVDVDVPQAGLVSPKGLSSAHVRKVSVALPVGMGISPGAADGLRACSDAEMGFGSDSDPLCPDGARIGAVTVDTPVLADSLDGAMYVAAQNSGDPMSGEMYRLFLFVRGPGVAIKLRGSVTADPATGQLRATFDNNPQLPFSKLRVELKDGPRAPLANPAGCGVAVAGAEMVSWATLIPAVSESSFAIDQRCDAADRFDPTLEAGTIDPVAGASSSLAVELSRPDGQQVFSGLPSLELPPGLLATLRGVTLCTNAQASAGDCPVGSRIGSATVAAGPGSAPFYLADQGVFLTEGYQGAPYGLAVKVRATAGPFDLGTVVVRQAIHVDPRDAHVTIASDAFPTIVKGIAPQIRSIQVVADRPRFVTNPTNCAQKAITANVTSARQGSPVSLSPSQVGYPTQTANTVGLSTRFQVGDCSNLAFKPRLKMSLTGRKQRRTGGHPALRTVLTQAKGQANIGKVKVTLPPSIALDAQNSYDPKLVCDYDRSLKADCPASTVIGKATANTPVLNKPLAGNVHLVQGIKFGPKGNRIRTTPSLLVKLRGEVAIDLRGQTTTEKGTNRLVTTFPAVPDAPVSKFDLRINGGSKGILTVTRTRRSKIDLCSASQVASVETDGQNGKRADYNTKVKTPCAAKASKAKAKARKAKQQRKTSKR